MKFVGRRRVGLAIVGVAELAIDANQPHAFKMVQRVFCSPVFQTSGISNEPNRNSDGMVFPFGSRTIFEPTQSNPNKIDVRGMLAGRPDLLKIRLEDLNEPGFISTA